MTKLQTLQDNFEDGMAVDAPKSMDSEPWYGHKFKEIMQGVWRCSCGKTLYDQNYIDRLVKK
jgi:hypothetical protein